MEPIYMMENRYSYLVNKWRPSQNTDFESESPETAFELHAHNLFIQGQTYLHREEYLLAYNAFRDLQSLILKTVHPKMPVDPNQFPGFIFPKDVTIIDALTVKAADILKQTKVPDYKFPSNLIDEDSTLSAEVQKKVNAITDVGLQVTSHHAFVIDQVEIGVNEAREGNWAAAVKRYNAALEKVPATDLLLRASLTHDLARSEEHTSELQSHA